MEKEIMGVQDLSRIHPIYRAAIDFCALVELPFTFKVDSGDYETAIQFKDKYFVHPPWSEDWDSNPEIICPDILILSCSKPIGVIEFEEETGPRKNGAHYARKGHGHEGDLDTKRDSRRNEYYYQAGFKVLRIWESQYKNPTVWKIILFEFLIQCWKSQKIKFN